MSISRREVLLRTTLGAVGAAGLFGMSSARGDSWGNGVVVAGSSDPLPQADLDAARAGADEAARAATAATAAATAGLVGDGVTDDGPALQAAYDTGGPAVQLIAGKNYLINSPVFFDKPSTYAMFIINMNGAKFVLGPKLPTTSAFWRDPATKWAFFPNTKRTAWSKTAGTVTVTAANRASGPSVGALLSLTIRNGTIDGNKTNAGLVFANRTGTSFEQVVLFRGRALLSWFDYCDINIFDACHNRAGGPADAVLIEQVASGDGLTMNSCKSDASVGIARLKFCRGAEITATVTGRIFLDSCSGIRIFSAHQESTVMNAPILIIRNSSVSIDSSVFYVPRRPAGSPPAAITIDDSVSEGHSDVMITNSQEMRAHDNADTDMGAFLSVISAAEATTVTATSLTSVTCTPGNGGTWLATTGPKFSIDGPAQALVDNARATIAGGHFMVGKRNGQLQVTNLVPPGAAVDPITPVIVTIGLAGADMSGGALSRVSSP